MAKNPNSQIGEVRSSKRCWNCRDRKIACDRALPGCKKCRQRGKACDGYGLRLSWPKADDVRRSARGDAHFIQRQTGDGYEFVDASKQDIDLFTGDATVHLDRDAVQTNFSMIITAPLTQASAPLALTYLDPSIADDGHSLVTSVFSGASDQFEDLYGLLVRMSLTDDGPPALATRHALSALSYQTLGQKEFAYAHQATAIRALQVSIDSHMQPSQYFQAMAASMLLNYYEILDENGSAASSAIYFCGCKRIALTVHKEHSDYQGDLALILDWVFYHGAMYKFSIHHWEKRTAAQVMVKEGPKILSKPLFSPMRHVVNPVMGCSLELLEIICQIVDVIRDPAEPMYHSPEHLRALRQAEIRLDGIVQHVSSVSGMDLLDVLDVVNNLERLCQPVSDATQYQETESRLYYVAAKLYLQRLGRAVDKQADAIQELLDEAFCLLKMLGRCKRPWLLFVVGVEARDEDERRQILKSMARAPGKRQPKNITLVKRLIQAAWTQYDLHCSEAPNKEAGLFWLYNAVISANAAPPQFA